MATYAQRSFASGEVSPALYARVDQTRYATGARQLRNTVVLRTGGTSMRPGTQFIAEMNTSGTASKLIPFISSAAQAYVIEAGASQFRFYKNGVQIQNSPLLITGITNANPAVVTIANHGYSNGDEISISGVGGMTQVNGRNFKVEGVTTNTFQLNYFTFTPVDSTTWGVFSSSAAPYAAKVYGINHIYAYADLPSLRSVQSADVMNLTARNYNLYTLSRYADLNWAFGPQGFGPNIQIPQNLNFSTGSGATTTSYYAFAITSVSATGEESLPLYGSYTANSPHQGGTGSWWTLTWAQASSGPVAVSFNVYQSVNGVYSFLGISSSNGGAGTFQFFGLDGATPQVSVTPPVFNAPSQTYGSIGYFQQRLFVGSSVSNPAVTIASRTGIYNNFSNGLQVLDTNSFNFTLVGRLVQEVRHYLDLGALIILTNEGEFVCEGNASGVVTSAATNLRQTSFVGSSTIPPLVIGNSAIFIQARGQAVFDLGYDFEVKGFNGNELSIFSNHLVDNYQIVAWAYQKRPHSIVWAVRNDGVLLSMTYVKGESIVAWARHDTLGTFEDVVCIPEGTTDAVYVIANRTIRGVQKRYLERLATNVDGDYLNSVYMDCALSYNGTNTTTTVTMTLSGGVNWTYDETLTLTNNQTQVALFTSTDVGNEFVLTGADGQIIRFTVTGYTSAQVVTGKANRTVPASLQNLATGTWAKGLKIVGGLWHLEGQKVSVVGDGFVVSNPNNVDDLQLTVASGQVTLDKAYTNIHVGLPYIADLETLSIDTAQGEPSAGKEFLMTAVHVHVQNTRGLWAGSAPPVSDSVDPLQNLTEFKTRTTGVENMNAPASMKTDVLEVNIQTEYSKGGRVFLRQIDPVPTSILAVEPAGIIPLGQR